MNKDEQNVSLSSLILFSVLILVFLGLISIYSASALKGEILYNNSYYFLEKKIIFSLAGFLTLLILSKAPEKILYHLTIPLLILSLTSLMLIFFPGFFVKAGGAERWIRLGFINFQPSELSKIALVFFLAKNLVRKECQIDRASSSLIPNLFVLGLFAFLLMQQPDFGTTALLSLTTIIMLYIAGIPKKYFAALILSGSVLFYFGLMTKSYRLKRLMVFWDPWADTKNSGFQIIQSFVAFRNGGLFGVGVGESKQKLFFLPESHTDFILSVIAEELGLIGVLLVCSLFLFISWCGFHIAFREKDPFKRLLCFGLSTIFTFQAFINIAVTMGLVPTKGIPLPFVSSGISSLMTFFFLIAVIIKIDKSHFEEKNKTKTYKKTSAFSIRSPS